MCIFILYAVNIFSQNKQMDEIHRLEEKYVKNNNDISVIKALANAYNGIKGMEYNVILYADKGLDINPDDEDLYRLKVIGLMKSEDYHKVQICINEKIKERKNPSYFDLLKRGQCKYNLEINDLAITDLGKAYRLNPQDPETVFSLGFVKDISSNNVNSSPYIDKAFRQLENKEEIFFSKKKSAVIYCIKAKQFEEKNNIDKAESCIEKALSYDLTNVEANIWKGRKKYLSSDYGEALGYFNEAITANTSSTAKADLLGYAALCKYKLYFDDPDKKYLIIESLTDAINAGCDIASVYLFRGIMNYNRKNIHQSILDFANAVEYDTYRLDYCPNDTQINKYNTDGLDMWDFIYGQYRNLTNQIDDILEQDFKR